MINIILCGGSGTRLWPVSRRLMPKQFIKLFDHNSLFQLTIKRNRIFVDDFLIVSNEEQYFLALDQIEELDIRNTKYLLEPIGKNTAPAIALACMDIDPNEIVLVTPSDHLIKNKIAYEDVIKKAEKLAEKDNLVTFGITPYYPETGFGYIESDGEDVKSFKEKPNINIAKEYIKKGNYYWNSGMFMFKAGILLEELEKYSPNIYQACETAYTDRKNHMSTLRIQQAQMELILSESIDYAVMEKSQKVKVVPSDINWSDLGSFDALYEELPKDEHGNTKNDKYINIDSTNNLIVTDDREIATIDIENLIIIDTPDALLISKRGSSQKVKKVVKKLKENNSELLNIHRKVHRPWGTYEVLLSHDNYKIKRIVVKQGKRLSLQKHYHRNEHWIVVSGTATVEVNNEVKLIRPNESTYIKMGEIHRLENQGKIPVVLIEAQVGEYTGEDDIVRIKDDYSRGEI